MSLFPILSNLRFQDVLDILLMTVLVYHLYLWFWGTKAFKALVGLVALGAVFTVARSWGLFLTTWVFQILWQVLVILLIILFQSEIRQALERVNPLRFIGFRAVTGGQEWIGKLARGVFSLAHKKIGALIVLERGDLVDELITGGIDLEGEPNRELLGSIFQKNSPLHDGAALIRQGKVAKVACYLPLSSREGVPEQWGTRHRAGLGLSERCDAWVIVVSEERGTVSIMHNGEATKIADEKQLIALVKEAVTPSGGNNQGLGERVFAILRRRFHLKVAALIIVTVFWLLLAGQQNFEVSLKVPLELKNTPNNLQILEPVHPELRITCRGLRKDASTLNPENVHAELDLTLAKWGRRTFRITRDQIVLPTDRIAIVRIEPSQLKFRFKEITLPKANPSQ
ncbi:MAG: hypothetical protein DRG63_11415 [Deltaproteobacteria bacterium]|nr:MAG: hypothetical protein DRG63_11415 [Deltaproteobacteria bacterium]